MSLRIANPFDDLENWQYYEFVYGFPQIAGAVVLDLGADVGSTVDFFLQKRARVVHAVEGTSKIFSQLKHNIATVLKDPDFIQVKPIFLYVDTVLILAKLLRDIRPGVVKHDLNSRGRHFENLIWELPSETLKIVDHWLIEAHSPGADRLLRACFEENAYERVRKSGTVLYFRSVR